MPEERPSFVKMLKQFFGIRPGRGVSDFMEEYKALTPKDKMDFYEAFQAAGMDCDQPLGSTAS